jgi:hypothetical protein
MTVQIGLKVDEAYSAADLNVQGKGFGANDEVISANGSVYKYVLSTDTIAAYDVLAVTSAGVASRLTTTNANDGVIIGVAQAALSSGYYGWMQVLGPTTVNCLSTCSAEVALFSTATAGSLDDTTNTVKIAGIQILANITAATGASGILVTRPFAAI